MHKYLHLGSGQLGTFSEHWQTDDFIHYFVLFHVKNAKITFLRCVYQ